MTLKHQRVAILVDGQNLYLSAKEYGEEQGVIACPNFDVLLSQVDGRKLVRAIAYIVELDGCNYAPFVKRLKKMGFDVRSKLARRLLNGRITKADWDMGIAMDAISLSDKIDTLILAGGDQDYIELVHMLRSRGVKVEAIAFKNAFSPKLMEAVDEAVALSPGPETLITRPKKKHLEAALADMCVEGDSERAEHDVALAQPTLSR